MDGFLDILIFHTFTFLKNNEVINIKNLFSHDRGDFVDILNIAYICPVSYPKKIAGRYANKIVR
ncbi:MAG TPA: hypothetical protein DCR95_14610 [Desulfobacter sp.]|nr:hypothetical protein [Desulfobacter sp.]